MKMKSEQHTELQLKGIIEILTQNTRELFSVQPFNTKIKDVLRREYFEGLETIEKDLNLNTNIITPSGSERQLEMLYNYVEQNIQNHIDTVGDRLRQELQRGLLNKEDKKQLIDRIKRVFKNDKDIINRLKTVIRTETNRANNTGRLESAKQAQSLGIEVKKWITVVPYQKGISSPFCNTPAGKNGKNSANGKYGTPQQAIDLDKNFIVKDGNKTVKALNPPFHPSCRSSLRIVKQQDIKRGDTT